MEGKCDFCGGELTIRKDDAPETVKARLDVYHAETEPLKDFYAQRGKLVKVDNQRPSRPRPLRSRKLWVWNDYHQIRS